LATLIKDLWRYFSESVDAALDMMHATSALNAELCDHECIVGRMMREAKFTSDEIARMATDLIVAAADTTSITATWVLHHLARDESEQRDVLNAEG
jgi:cytochrome P450